LRATLFFFFRLRPLPPFRLALRSNFSFAIFLFAFSFRRVLRPTGCLSGRRPVRAFPPGWERSFCRNAALLAQLGPSIRLFSHHSGSDLTEVCSCSPSDRDFASKTRWSPFRTRSSFVEALPIKRRHYLHGPLGIFRRSFQSEDGVFRLLSVASFCLRFVQFPERTASRHRREHPLSLSPSASSPDCLCFFRRRILSLIMSFK